MDFERENKLCVKTEIDLFLKLMRNVSSFSKSFQGDNERTLIFSLVWYKKMRKRF